MSLPEVGESGIDTITPSKFDEPSGTSEEEDEPVVEPVDNTSGAPTSQSRNDTNKKRRRKRKTSNPLESVCCRGICGFASNCVSQKSLPSQNKTKPCQYFIVLTTSTPTFSVHYGLAKHAPSSTITLCVGSVLYMTVNKRGRFQGNIMG